MKKVLLVFLLVLGESIYASGHDTVQRMSPKKRAKVQADFDAGVAIMKNKGQITGKVYQSIECTPQEHDQKRKQLLQDRRDMINGCSRKCNLQDTENSGSVTTVSSASISNRNRLEGNDLVVVSSNKESETSNITNQSSRLRKMTKNCCSFLSLKGLLFSRNNEKKVVLTFANHDEEGYDNHVEISHRIKKMKNLEDFSPISTLAYDECIKSGLNEIYTASQN